MDVYHFKLLHIDWKGALYCEFVWFQFVSKTFNLLVKHGKLLKQDGMVTKNFVACIHNARLHSFFALYDSLAENVSKQFLTSVLCRVCQRLA